MRKADMQLGNVRTANLVDRLLAQHGQDVVSQGAFIFAAGALFHEEEDMKAYKALGQLLDGDRVPLGFLVG
jgi:hypothetical protein